MTERAHLSQPLEIEGMLLATANSRNNVLCDSLSLTNRVLCCRWTKSFTVGLGDKSAIA